MKQLLPLLAILVISRAHAQEVPEPYNPPITCLDIKAGVTSYLFLSKKFNDDRYLPGSHGAVDYPRIQTVRHKGESPFVMINGASRISNAFEVSYGLSYMYYVNDVSFQDKTVSKIQNSDFYLKTDHSADVRVTNHLTRLSVAPVFRIFNTKIEIGVLNLGYVNYSTKILSQQYRQVEAIPKHNSYLDSVVIVKESQPSDPDLKLKNRFNLSFSLGVEQEIPIKKYRYLVGVKGMLSGGEVLAGIVYIGIRFSKPYTWKD